MFSVQRVICTDCEEGFPVPFTNNSDVTGAIIAHTGLYGEPPERAEVWSETLYRWVPPFRFAPCNFETQEIRKIQSIYSHLCVHCGRDEDSSTCCPCIRNLACSGIHCRCGHPGWEHHDEHGTCEYWGNGDDDCDCEIFMNEEG